MKGMVQYSIFATIALHLMATSTTTVNRFQSFPIPGLNPADIFKKVRVIRLLESGKCIVYRDSKPEDSNHGKYIGVNEAEHPQNNVEVVNSKLKLADCKSPKLVTNNESDQDIKVGIGSQSSSHSKAKSYTFALTQNRRSSAAVQTYKMTDVTKCEAGNPSQQWTPTSVPSRAGVYQIVHYPSSRCLQAAGPYDGAWVRIWDCDPLDPRQQWTVCDSKGDCLIESAPISPTPPVPEPGTSSQPEMPNQEPEISPENVLPQPPTELPESSFPDPSQNATDQEPVRPNPTDCLYMSLGLSVSFLYTFIVDSLPIMQLYAECLL